MAYFAPITAASDIPTCPDCGSFAQGRGYFGNPYCGLCERSIPEAPLVVAPNAFTTVYVAKGGLQVWA